MKIIHTADWHIGKIVNGVHMTKDQEYILDQFINIISEEKPDVILIAGDLYDRGVPPVEAVELLDRVFSKILLELKVPIITIAGNHDSRDRISFGSEILKDKGLYICGKFNGEVEKVVIKDEAGPVNFYLIPYLDPAEVREILKDETIKNHDNAMKAILQGIKLNRQERNIAIAHGFIAGTKPLEKSDSERPLAIGGTEVIDVDYFKDFDYVALGHLHGRQKVSREAVMYSGSILKYSFSEVNHKKGVIIINLGKNENVEVGFRELMPIRDMRKIKGEIAKLTSEEVYRNTNVEDYIHAILTDEGELIDPIGKLREVYPNVLSLERVLVNKDMEEVKTSAGSNVKEKSKLELFKSFYSNITGKDFTEEKESIISAVIEEVERVVK